ncbi:MAG: pyruvate kinase [Planctomycetales bacterium]|nr:pyruvate kinase [Planctomycetales bacterium]MBN8624590.1 pyruvate kinase [Planctomycetota bacterium]
MNAKRFHGHRAHTKIIATVGPASREEAQLSALIDAGVDVFRLNMAHGEMHQHEEVLGRIRKLSAAKKHPVAVLVDLAGPKIRLGEIPGGSHECVLGEEFAFIREDETSDPRKLTSTYDRLVDELQVGDRVMLADGTVSMLVESKTREGAKCRCVQAGLIRSRQGINLPGVKVSLPAMSEEDKEHAVWAAKNGIDYVSLSFVRSPKEVLELKWLLDFHHSPARVIAKIEKQEALDQLEAIVAATDGIMVARGDLGVEIDVARMPVVQKQIIAMCHRYQKPVIVATQMLDSMQRSPRPTRAEVTDVANAILDGCDACMLSGETAVGDYPTAAVEMMNRVALATEPLFAHRSKLDLPDMLPEGLELITHGVVLGAATIAKQLDAKMMIVVSNSGVTALAVSKHRTLIPILGVSNQESTIRQMCLYWGVVPMPEAPTTDSFELLSHVQKLGLESGTLNNGDHLVLVAGIGLASKGHNMVRVHTVGQATG